MNWDINRDQFQFSFEEICEFATKLPFTKHNLLRIPGMFYDPLGVIPSMVLQTCLLFKNICNKKLAWDVIPAKFAKEQNNLLKSLGNIKHINIDGYVSATSNPDDVLELHGFCDASTVAYCAAIYIRVISNSPVIRHYLWRNVDLF